MILDQYESDLIRRRAAPDTLAGYRHTAKLFRHVDPTKESIHRWLADHDWAPTTQRTHVMRLRAAYQLAVELEQIPTNPFTNLRLAPIQEHVPRIVSADMVRALEADCRSHQELLWLRMHTYTGMRASEVLGVTVNDVDGNFMLVKGKSKQRRVPIHPELRRLMVEHRGSPYYVHGPQGQQLSRRGSLNRIRVLRAGRDVQLHDFRRTVVTRLRRARADVDAIRSIVGHSRGGVWALYSAIEDEDLYAAILKLSY